MTYNAQIDGLRALAVIPVVLYHAGFATFSGGFVGVDIFFVISGYLITGILLEDLENKCFSLSGFYERRARRLLPALFFITGITVCFAVIYFPPHALKDLGQSIFATSLFISNLFFYLESDYFNNIADSAPLLHTWSLAVEEQFYIIFPIILCIIYKYPKRVQIITISTLVLISLIASEILTYYDQSLAFFLSLTRFWEIGLGSIIYMLTRSYNLGYNKMSSEIFAYVGIILLIFPIFLYSSKTIFPGFAALPPTIGTALIILFARDNTFVGILLKMKLLRAFGLISYSLYLSHHVVFSLSLNVGKALETTALKFLAISISIIIAIFSYFMIERPARYAKINKAPYFLVMIALCLIFAAFGYYLHKSHGLEKFKMSRISSKYKDTIIDANLELKKRRPIWDVMLKNSQKPFSENNNSYKILIVGDSKSEDLYVGLMTSSLGRKYEIRRINIDYPTVKNPIKNKFGYKNNLFNDADEIVLTSTWQIYAPFQYKSDHIAFILWLIENGKKVSLVSTSNFNHVASLSYFIAKNELEGFKASNYIYRNIRNDLRTQFKSLKQSVNKKTNEVRFLEKLSAFCVLDQYVCNLKPNGEWLIYDAGHVTFEGAKILGEFAKKNWWPDD